MANLLERPESATTFRGKQITGGSKDSKQYFSLRSQKDMEEYLHAMQSEEHLKEYVTRKKREVLDANLDFHTTYIIAPQVDHLQRQIIGNKENVTNLRKDIRAELGIKNTSAFVDLVHQAVKGRKKKVTAAHYESLFDIDALTKKVATLGRKQGLVVPVRADAVKAALEIKRTQHATQNRKRDIKKLNQWNEYLHDLADDQIKIHFGEEPKNRDGKAVLAHKLLKMTPSKTKQAQIWRRIHTLVPYDISEQNNQPQTEFDRTVQKLSDFAARIRENRVQSLSAEVIAQAKAQIKTEKQETSGIALKISPSQEVRPFTRPTIYTEDQLVAKRFVTRAKAMIAQRKLFIEEEQRQIKEAQTQRMINNVAKVFFPTVIGGFLIWALKQGNHSDSKPQQASLQQATVVAAQGNPNGESQSQYVARLLKEAKDETGQQVLRERAAAQARAQEQEQAFLATSVEVHSAPTTEPSPKATVESAQTATVQSTPTETLTPTPTVTSTETPTKIPPRVTPTRVPPTPTVIHVKSAQPSSEPNTFTLHNHPIELTGTASWYSREGCMGCSSQLRTATGEPLRNDGMTAAIRSDLTNVIPLGSEVTIFKASNPDNKKKIRINDTGTLAKQRIIDVTPAVRDALGIRTDIDQIVIEKES